MPVMNIASRGWNIDRFPAECPWCRATVAPIQMSAADTSPDAEPASRCVIVFQCPGVKCRSMFIARYRRVEAAGRDYRLVGVDPSAKVIVSIDQIIEGLSPEFCATYQQAMQADAWGLDRIAGAGLRRALEFLVKAYAAHLAPESSATIEKAALGAVINAHLGDDRLRSGAELAAWIGNDETHVVRRWTAHDIRDLKALIRIVMTEVASALRLAKFQTEMPSRDSAPGPRGGA